jgi:NADH:ubiquinone oxidoreductase subunit F (NADH-binding)
MTGAHSLLTESHGRSEARPAHALPRLLEGIPAAGAMDLGTHVSLHGPLPAVEDRRAHRLGRKGESALIGRIERAGLRGRGGAAFPTATKLRAVAQAGRRPIVVVNATEGEPASLKDRTLSEMLPHLVLDGGQLAAEAVGAHELVVCVCESADTSVMRVADAIAERERLGLGRVPMRVTAVPDHYVAGEESALINHLNGGPAVPTFRGPMPFEQGVKRQPTLLSNAETFAHIALIARHGSLWFRELGTPAQPGSALVTVSGPIAYPGVYEIETGASLSALIDAAGGANARIRAALLGGYAGTWVGGEHVGGLLLSDDHLATHGASLGAGVVLLLSENACPVAETARVGRWLAEQSTGQCGPCVNGLGALAASIEEIAAGVAASKASQRIARLASLVQGRGACSHPDGAVRFILSALDTFGAEFSDHAHRGRCDQCMQPPEMPLTGSGSGARRAPESASIL